MAELLTLAQIADMAGITPQSAGRYLRKHGFNPGSRQGSTLLYDRETIKPALDHWESRTGKANTAADDKLIVLLKAQLDEKDRQIASLQKLLDQQQQLAAATAKQLDATRENLRQIENPAHTGFWNRLFHRDKRTGTGEDNEES